MTKINDTVKPGPSQSPPKIVEFGIEITSKTSDRGKHLVTEEQDLHKKNVGHKGNFQQTSTCLIGDIIFLHIAHWLLMINLNFFLVIQFSKKWPANRISAESACRALGGKWKVTRIFSGSLICSTVDWKLNCHTCDEWRLYVWTDGATDNNSRKECQRNKTFSGSYYCGHSPCKICGDLPYEGRWIEGISLMLYSKI